METTRICPSCGKPVAAEAPQGICPECLMKAGFGSAPRTTAQEPGPSFEPPSVAELASVFPQLEILELIGQGGMGAVFRARQPALDRPVALKVLPPQAGADPGFAERFTREARALARLTHPNIVAVYDFGQVNNLHYLLMEYVDGLNLRQLEATGKLPPAEALKLIPPICEALQFAHDEGVVHRDIKPENVLVDKKGRVKIADFGLARILGREPTTLRLTGARDVVGTPHYMAPEQLERPRDVDHRADIFSLGVVIYEMLTGELPIGRFEPPSRKVLVDVRLDNVVLHALEKEPERRYQHASQIKADVENISRAPAGPSEPPVQAAAPSLAEDPVRSMVKWPAMGLVTTGVFNWVALPVILAFALPILARAAHNAKASGGPELPFVALLIAPFVLCAILIASALKMMRLENYGSAIGASLVAMLVTPGNLLGFPVGIWALSVLLRKETRLAFQARDAAARKGGARRHLGGMAVLWTLGLGLLVFSVVGAYSLNRAAQRAVQVDSGRVVKSFSPADKPISTALQRVDGAWSISVSTNATIRLFEVENPGVEKSVLTYRAALKSDDLQGRAYLEMWCRFPGQGEFFSRGLDKVITGPNNWAESETVFRLRNEEKPDLVRLNLVVEGKGTIQLKDLELVALQPGL